MKKFDVNNIGWLTVLIVCLGAGFLFVLMNSVKHDIVPETCIGRSEDGMTFYWLVVIDGKKYIKMRTRNGSSLVPVLNE